MMLGKEEKDDDALPASFRWDLALDIRKRADQSADFLRALLLALSAGEASFAAERLTRPNTNTYCHLSALILFAVSVLILVVSWSNQKGKSLKRYKVLRYDGLEKYESEDRAGRFGPPNSVQDSLACAFLLIGTVFEISGILWDR